MTDTCTRIPLSSVVPTSAISADLPPNPFPTSAACIRSRSPCPRSPPCTSSSASHKAFSFCSLALSLLAVSARKACPLGCCSGRVPPRIFALKGRGRWPGQPPTPKGKHASHALLVSFALQSRCGCHCLRRPLHLRSLRTAEKNHGSPGKRGHRPQGSYRNARAAPLRPDLESQLHHRHSLLAQGCLHFRPQLRPRGHDVPHRR